MMKERREEQSSQWSYLKGKTGKRWSSEGVVKKKVWYAASSRRSVKATEMQTHHREQKGDLVTAGTTVGGGYAYPGGPGGLGEKEKVRCRAGRLKGLKMDAGPATKKIRKQYCFRTIEIRQNRQPRC